MQFSATTTPAYTIRDQERMQLAPRYFAWQAELAQAALGNRVLEIGCGVGNFTEHLLGKSLVVAIDIEGSCIERIAESFPRSANLVAQKLDVLDPAFTDLRRYQIDSIVCLNVLEHVRDDTQALRHMHAMLPPGGRVVLIVPAFEALYGPIDRRLGHFRRYTKRSVRTLARNTGYVPAVLRYMNVIGMLGWYCNAHILRFTEQSARQIAIFDKYCVPVMRRLESWIAPPFGQSLFAVLEKA